MNTTGTDDGDPFDLTRFVRAQDDVAGFDAVRGELKQGEKRGHWMWYVFPQVKGLGVSDMAWFYGISSLEEAKAYLDHPVVGPRIRECTRLVMDIRDRSLEEIFGETDSLKFRSSMTLFSKATTDSGIFGEALSKCCDGQMDKKTLQLLSQDK